VARARADIPALAEHRRRRRRFGTAAWPAWAPVAALVAALLLAVPLLAGGLGGGGDDDQETAAFDAAGDDAGAAGDAGDAETGAEGAGSGGSAGRVEDDTLAATAGQAEPDLGPIENEQQLREAVGATIGTGGDEGASTTTAQAFAEEDAAPAAPRCDRPDLGPPVYRARVTYAGTPGAVLAYVVGDTVRVLVLADGDCAVLADVTI
jgi:hypothetical protein